MVTYSILRPTKLGVKYACVHGDKCRLLFANAYVYTVFCKQETSFGCLGGRKDIKKAIQHRV
jgi:hypothetical protein